MAINIYKVVFNSNHPQIVMKTSVWIHEDVLDYFKEHIKAYAKRKGFMNYTEQQVFVDQYLQAYRKIVEKYESIGLTDAHIKSVRDEYNEVLLKNDLLEKYHFFVAPKHLDAYFSSPKIDMERAVNLLNMLKGADGLIKPGMSDWVGYHERKTSRVLRMEFR